MCVSREVGYLTGVNDHTDVSCLPVLPSSAAGNIAVGSNSSMHVHANMEKQ